MVENNITRKRLLKVLDEQGIKMSFIAKKLDWDYTNLSKFKNDKYIYSHDKLIELNNFLNQYDKRF